MCIARQSGALADRGYAITPVPVRFAPTVFLAGVFAVVLLSSIAVLWLSSRAPALEAQPLNYSLSEFKNSKGDVLPADAFSGGFVRYVRRYEVGENEIKASYIIKFAKFYI